MSFANEKKTISEKLNGKIQKIINLKTCTIVAELHVRASRACGRSPIAKVIYPSQKIW